MWSLAKEALGMAWFALEASPELLSGAWHRALRSSSVRYGERTRNVLDIFPSERSAGPGSFLQPVLVFVHGGAWGFGDRWHVANFARRLAAGGMSVVVPNYTLFPGGDVDEMLGDLNDFGLDPTRIYLSGHSSGAHLAALVLLQNAVLAELHPAAETSWRLSQIRGFVGLSGVYDVVDHYEHEASRGLAEVSPMKPAMQGFEQFAAHSPTRLATRLGKCPGKGRLAHVRFQLVHGSGDQTVPLLSSARFVGALVAAGVREASLTELDCGHMELVIPHTPAASVYRDRAVAVVLQVVRDADCDAQVDEHMRTRRRPAAARRECE